MRRRARKVGQRPEPRGRDAMLCAVNSADYFLAIKHHGPVVRAGAGDLGSAEGEVGRRRARRGGPCPESINHVLFPSCVGMATENYG